MLLTCVWLGFYLIHWTLMHYFGNEERIQCQKIRFLSFRKKKYICLLTDGPDFQWLSLPIPAGAGSECVQPNAMKISHEEMVRLTTQKYFWNTTSVWSICDNEPRQKNQLVNASRWYFQMLPVISVAQHHSSQPTVAMLPVEEWVTYKDKKWSEIIFSNAYFLLQSL